MALFWVFCLLTAYTTWPHIQTIAGYVPAQSIAITLHMYEKGISTYRERVTQLFLFMVSVDKSCATTSTWKPGAQLLLTINYMQPNPDYNDIYVYYLRTMTSRWFH